MRLPGFRKEKMCVYGAGEGLFIQGGGWAGRDTTCIHGFTLFRTGADKVSASWLQGSRSRGEPPRATNTLGEEPFNRSPWKSWWSLRPKHLDLPFLRTCFPNRFISVPSDNAELVELGQWNISRRNRCRSFLKERQEDIKSSLRRMRPRSETRAHTSDDPNPWGIYHE